jgi:hypothetical protein
VAKPTWNEQRQRWQVIRPPAGGEPRQRRYFRTRTEAVTFAAGIKGLRDHSLNDFVRLDPAVRARLMRCLDLAGGIHGLEAATVAFLAARPKVDKLLSDATLEFVEANRRHGRSKPYVHGLETALRPLLKHCGPVSVSSVSSSTISAWVDSLDVQPVSVDTYLRKLTVFFHWACRKTYTTANPMDGVIRPKVPPPTIHILTPTDAQTLLETCRKVDRPFLPYFAVGLFAGIRPAELLRLTEESVRVSHIEVKASQSKTRQRRLVEIHPTLAAWLAIPGVKWALANARTRFERVVEASGLDWHQDIMRHSFCSYAYPIRGAVWTSIQSGHSESMLFKHYRELVTEDQAREFWAILP